jgi:hypothetical protein
MGDTIINGAVIFLLGVFIGVFIYMLIKGRWK